MSSTLCTPITRDGQVVCLICGREEGAECLYATLRHGMPRPIPPKDDDGDR